MYHLTESTKKDKKLLILTPNGHKIHFGMIGYSDYTIYHDKTRRKNYILRHANKEDWTESGINTAGFWSYWILWNKPSIKKSIKKVEKLFKIKIIYHKNV